MALTAQLNMATIILDPLGRGLRVSIQVQDDVLGPLGLKTITIDDAELFAQVVTVVQSYLPYLQQKIQVPVTLPPNLPIANTA